MPFDPALLLGPFGVVIAAGYAVKRLWDSHDKSDADVIAHRNEAIAGWREADKTTDRLAAAVEALTARLDKRP
jgi:hypothetical protein